MNREIPLVRNWYALGLVGGLALLLIAAIFGTVDWPAILALQAHRPLPNGWSWWSLVVANAVTLLAAAGLCVAPLRTLRAVLTEREIRQPRWLGIRGERVVRWADVSAVERAGAAVRISGSGQTIILNRYLFRDERQLLAEIARRVPPGAAG